MVEEDWEHIAPLYDTREHRSTTAAFQTRDRKEKEMMDQFIQQEPCLEYVKVPINYMTTEFKIKFNPKNDIVYCIPIHYLKVEKIKNRYYCCKNRVDLFKKMVIMLMNQ